MFVIHPTKEQIRLLNGPLSIKSLNAADFLGRQTYIDTWIKDWFKHNLYKKNELPLCVSESIICYKKLKKKYKKKFKHAVIKNDYEWISTHSVVPVNVWSVVEFLNVSDKMFDTLWSIQPAPADLGIFIIQSRRMHFWKPFVDLHGPTQCLKNVVQSLWSEGTRYCLAEGADVDSEDVVKYCIRSSDIFRQVTMCNPPATLEAYEEFKLQRLLNRIEDVPLIEEWFWINGFK
jgi:hypothetical protein